MANRPSFVIFITDQQQAGMLGCAGDALVQTPNIDAMAANGTMFDRFHVAMPSCMPNRASLLTGLYPSVNKVRFNGIPLPQDAVTFPRLFQDNGYRTGLVGKGHLQPILEPYPDQTSSTGDWWRRELDDRGREICGPYYGYDPLSVVTGHGDQCGGNYEAWLAERLPDYQSHIGPQNQLPHNYSCPQAVRTKLPEEVYPTAYIEEEAIGFLERHAALEGQNPFLLVVSFPDPHHPFNPPGRYWDMYDPDDVTLPENFAAPNTDLPHLQAVRAARSEGTDNRDGYGAVGLGEREAREAIALTYGMITMIDDAIGRVRAKMAELGLAEETIEIFTSDHGDLLGDHGLMFKGPLHYQSLIRVPFVMTDPHNSNGGGRDNRLFSGVDLAASLCDRAGIPDPGFTHGLSVFDGKSDRTSLLIEDEYQTPTLCFDTAPSLRTLVTDCYRMTVFHGQDWGEIYDLYEDPHEIRNLWSSDQHRAVQEDLLRRLADKMMEATDRRDPPRSVA